MTSRRYTNVSVSRTPSIARSRSARNAQQGLVVLADGLDQQVVRAGGDDHVVDLGHLGELLGDLDQLSLSQRIPIIAIWWKPSLSGSVTPTTWRMPRSIEPVRPGPDGRLGHAEIGGDLGERPAAVGLEVLDDPLVEVATRRRRPRTGRGRGRPSVVIGCSGAVGVGCRVRPQGAGVAVGAADGDGSLAPRSRDLHGTIGALAAAARGADRGARRAPSAPATWRSSGFGGSAPVVGPHSMRMFMPAKATGGSPWPGASPASQVAALARSADGAVLG